MKQVIIGRLYQWASLLLIWMGAIGASAAPSPEHPLPSRDELHSMYDAGQYRICLQQIARLMQSSNTERSDNKFDLLLLRGNCLLHLQDAETAAEAFSAVAKSPSLEQAALGRASGLLIARSVKLSYAPEGAREGAPIDIVDDRSRKSAFKALFTDEWVAKQSVVNQALEAQNLLPIHEAIPTLADLQSVEIAATGQDTQMRPLLRGIGDRARELIARELDSITQRIDSIESTANSAVDSPIAGEGWWYGGARHGLYTPERHELRQTIQYLQRIHDTSINAQLTARSFGSDGTKWDPIITRTNEIQQRAQQVLDRE